MRPKSTPECKPHAVAVAKFMLPFVDFPPAEFEDVLLPKKVFYTQLNHSPPYSHGIYWEYERMSDAITSMTQ